MQLAIFLAVQPIIILLGLRRLKANQGIEIKDYVFPLLYPLVAIFISGIIAMPVSLFLTPGSGFGMYLMFPLYPIIQGILVNGINGVSVAESQIISFTSTGIASLVLFDVF